MQYTLARENHITVVVGCRKGQRHQCRPPIFVLPVFCAVDLGPL